MASITGFRLRPTSVKEYSTLGGTSGYTFRLTSPSASMLRRLAVSTFWDMLPMDRFRALNRMVPYR